MKFPYFALLVMSAQFAFSAAASAGSLIANHINMSLVTNVISDSYEEWKKSRLTPEDIFSAVAAKNSEQEWKNLCESLDALNNENLALFDPEITAGDHSAKLPCRKHLTARLRKYWSEVRVNMAAEHAIEASPKPAAPTAWTIKQEVEYQKGPIFIDGGLAKGQIALTFDDGPHPTRTPRVLKILKEAGIRATFFCVGEMAKNYPKLVKQAADEGHVMGSHSWNHSDMARLPQKNAEHNILRGHDAVMVAAGGIETPFFRFPYGSKNKAIQAFVQHIPMATFFWNLDSSDWKLRNPSVLLDNVKRVLDSQKGGIILFHDIQEQTVIALPHVIEEIKKRKMTPVVFIPKAILP